MRFLKLAILAFSLIGIAQAQMAESLKSEFHKEEELGVRAVGKDEITTIKGLISDPKIRVIALQVLQEEMDMSLATPLITWVQAGHSLWIYDARLGSLFGFQPVMMKRNQFTNKDEKGNLGGRSLEGVGTVALAMGGGAINTGVGQVSCFLPKVEGDIYGAVNVTADTQSLLRFTYNSPAVAAYRRDGKGMFVFKPLLWPDALSGERFQSNLLEFSAGFQVPGPAGTDKVGKPPGPEAEFVIGKPASGNLVTPSAAEANHKPQTGQVVAIPQNPDHKDEVEVVGEGIVLGLITNEKLDFETGTSSIKLTRAEVESVDLSAAGQLDTVHWRDGRTSKGLLMSKTLDLDINGESRKLEKKLLRKIRWSLQSIP